MPIVPHLIKISNVLVYFYFLWANIYSVAGPDQDKSPYADSHPTYITPSEWVFGIWGVTLFLLFGFVIHQFFSAAQETVIEGIHWHFVVIILLNSLWLNLWQTDHLILSLIVILFVVSSVTYVHYKVRNNYPAQGINDALWLHAPFSFYHAWVIVILVINIFAAFTQEAKPDENPTLLTQILVTLGLVFLKAFAIAHIELDGKVDFVCALVITCTLIGVACKQNDLFIHWTALVFSVLTTIYCVKHLVKKYIFKSREESSPLLG